MSLITGLEIWNGMVEWKMYTVELLALLNLGRTISRAAISLKGLCEQVQHCSHASILIHI